MTARGLSRTHERKARLALVGLLALCVAPLLWCVKRVPFACETDAQCSGRDGPGRCEPSGHCSFADPQCPTGRRYGAAAPGGLGGTCVAPGAVSGQGCGTLGEECCDGVCDPGATCVDGICCCGGLGQACCSGWACGAHLACAGDAGCRCGGRDEPCCEGETCGEAGLTCAGVDAGTVCQCGGRGQPCCADSTCESLDLVCATVSGGQACTCGARGEPCCEGTTCATADLSCVPAAGGTACQCGALGEPCCEGTSCNGTLTCVGLLCACMLDGGVCP
jgi:hypothetical protein